MLDRIKLDLPIPQCLLNFPKGKILYHPIHIEYSTWKIQTMSFHLKNNPFDVLGLDQDLKNVELMSKFFCTSKLE